MAKKKKKNRKKRTVKQSRNSSFLSFFLPQFIFEGRAQHGCDRVIHLEYANSWQCICLLVLDLPLGGRSPTQLRSLSAVCLKTPVILPHSATLRQSHFSTSHPPCVCLEAVWMRWGRLLREERCLMRGDKWWGSLTSVAAPRFIATVLETFSGKTPGVNIITISEGWDVLVTSLPSFVASGRTPLFHSCGLC